MRRATAYIPVAVLLAVTACSQAPRGKDYFERHPSERATVLKACADGTHGNQQECANAADVDVLLKARRSFGR